MMQQQQGAAGGDVLYFGVFLNGWMDFLVVRLKKDAASGLWDFGGGDLIKYPLCGMIFGAELKRLRR